MKTRRSIQITNDELFQVIRSGLVAEGLIPEAHKDSAEVRIETIKGDPSDPREAGYREDRVTVTYDENKGL